MKKTLKEIVGVECYEEIEPVVKKIENDPALLQFTEILVDFYNNNLIEIESNLEILHNRLSLVVSYTLFLTMGLVFLIVAREIDQDKLYDIMFLINMFFCF